jgi:hypothetical protein
MATYKFLGAFNMYGEKNYQYMKSTMEKLKAIKESLSRPYNLQVGVFPANHLILGENPSQPLMLIMATLLRPGALSPL